MGVKQYAIRIIGNIGDYLCFVARRRHCEDCVYILRGPFECPCCPGDSRYLLGSDTHMCPRCGATKERIDQVLQEGRAT